MKVSKAVEFVVENAVWSKPRKTKAKADDGETEEKKETKKPAAKKTAAKTTKKTTAKKEAKTDKEEK